MIKYTINLRVNLSQALKTNFINNKYQENGIEKCFEKEERQEKIQMER